MSDTSEALWIPGRGERVAVIGLSKTGESVSDCLRARGAEVRVIEEFYAPAMRERRDRLISSGCDVRTGSDAGSGIGFLEGCTVVITSPGVPAGAPILVAAREQGLTIWSEFELAFRILEERRHTGLQIDLVAVTGTNGKTTVVSLIAEAGRAAGRDAVACGNIGYPFVDAVRTAAAGSLLVAEASSFQLHFSETLRPDVAALINFAPDHLDWHTGMDEYAHAKGQIFAAQSDGDVAVWNADDPGAVAIANRWAPQAATRLPFTKFAPEPGGVGVADGRIVSARNGTIMNIEDLPACTAPAVENALAVAAVTDALDLPGDAVAIAVGRFSGLPHRLEPVAESDGRAFIDDSKATNPHAARSAIKSFESVVLIAGGKNKGLDLAAMHGFGDIEVIKRLKGVVGLGESAGAVTRAFDRPGLAVADAPNMREAVALAAAMAGPGDTVLLSPGCASFDQYSSYAERGDDFKAEVGRYLAGGD